MINYQQGNSYGNGFINGDEALFEDASLQRDSFGFQIRPGVQSNKNDWRTANSGIVAQTTILGERVIGANVIGIAKLKDKYSSSDLSDMSSFTPYSSVTITADSLKSTPMGNPYAYPNNGDVYISKTGAYAVTLSCQFIAPTGYSNPQNYSFYTFLMVKDKGKSEYRQMIYNQQRGVSVMDLVSLVYIGIFNEGDRVNVGFMHTYTTKDFLCCPAINLYRLS